MRPVFSVYCTREITLKFIRNMFSNMYSTTIVTPQIANYEVDKVSTQNPYTILVVIWKQWSDVVSHPTGLKSELQVSVPRLRTA